MSVDQLPWRKPAISSLVSTVALQALAVLPLLGSSPAHAENELSQLAMTKGTQEIVNPQCFAEECKSQTEACFANSDCMKGLVCTGKCMGNTQCVVGCFAKFGNQDLDSMMTCTIEEKKCINIAILEPGGDSPLEAPKPPVPVIQASAKDMDGKWYKVMGLNPSYDCFDCQKNTFHSDRAVEEVSAEIRGSSKATLDVEYSMPRERAGRPREDVPNKVSEQIIFDGPDSQRTAHTEGKMFGVTFWENWYVIGKENFFEPEFRFVYYNGKTLQNRYEGAFVYARTPDLPRSALPSIYAIAEKAGFTPTGMCHIQNSCFDNEPVDMKGPFGNREEVAYAAAAPRQAPMTAADSAESLGPVQRVINDVAEFIEDPQPYGQKLFANQRKMSETEDLDRHGYSQRQNPFHSLFSIADKMIETK
jgi:hypothetical protein